MLVLLFVALWFILRGDLFCLVYFLFFLFFSPFSISITLLGEERANLSVLFYVCSFSLVWFLSVFSSSSCLRCTAACDCGTPWIFSFTFFD